MSVFATHHRPHYARVLGVLLAVCAVIAGSIYFGKVIRGPLTASQLGAVLPSFTPASVALETVFPQPQAIDWEGAVIGVLSGGQGIAIRPEGSRPFQAYMPDGQTTPITEGSVRIRGQWTGVSCAYANTVFGGQCSPTVDIDSVEALPIQPE